VPALLYGAGAALALIAKADRATVMTQPFTAVAIGETVFIILPYVCQLIRVVCFFYRFWSCRQNRDNLGLLRSLVYCVQRTAEYKAISDPCSTIQVITIG
jgi:hypothetical protein